MADFIHVYSFSQVEPAAVTCPPQSERLRDHCVCLPQYPICVGDQCSTARSLSGTEDLHGFNPRLCRNCACVPRAQAKDNGTTPKCGIRRYSMRGEPKSGTTWLEYMLTSMFNIAHTKLGGTKTESRSKFQRWHAMQWSSCHGTTSGLNFSFAYKHRFPLVSLPNGKDDGYADGIHHNGPHLFVPLVPSCIREKHVWECDSFLPYAAPPSPSMYEDDFFIMLLRDPRATALSSHRYWSNDSLRNKLQPRCNGTNACVLLYTEALSAWIAFRYHWHTKILDPEHTKVVFYEDLQDNPTEGVASMAAFMGLDFSESDISQVVNVSSKEHMRSLEKAGALFGSKGNFKGHQVRKVGKGEKAEYLRTLDHETLKACERVMKRYLQPELQSRWLQ